MLLGLMVFITSAAALAYEVLLMRLLSITQWHHFAYMIISLAMLGFGASGTFVVIAYKWLSRRFRLALTANGLLFSITVVVSFAAAQRVPLNPLEILWDGKQTLYLVQVYLLLSLPFLFAANCILLTLARLKDRIHQIYLFDLLGAGVGASGIVLLLAALPPTACLRVLSAFGLLAAGLAVLNEKSRKSILLAAIFFCFGCLLPFAWPAGWLVPRISEYKGLNMALRIPEARVIEERFSPLSSIAVVRSPAVPFRYAPGMSLNCPQEPPPQLGIFIDGDAMSPITRYDGRLESLSYLDCLTSALPYHLPNRSKVLVLGAGGGMDVLMALYHRAESVDAVELDYQIVDLLQRPYKEYAGRIYDPPFAKVHVAEARGFVASTSESFDLIQVSLLDSFNTSVAGGYALNETYLYTIEAFQEYLRHLKPGGLLAITRWLKFPPRESLKLFATAVAAMEESGVGDPGQHLALIRSWNTTTLLVRNGAFSHLEAGQIRAFCDARSFDIDYAPWLSRSDVNRYNIIEEPLIYDGAEALLGEGRNDFIRDYKFTITPATDDRPYFFHFIKWSTLPEIVSLKEQGGLPLIEWTFPILVLTLLQAFVVSLVWILLPLRVLGPMPGSKRLRSRICLYFVCLGLAFMAMEIALIQKFILFLSHPVYAVSVVLSAFLIFAGLGSSLSRRWGCWIVGRGGSGPGMPGGLSLAGIILVSVLYVFVLSPLFERFMVSSDFGKILLSIALIGPLALFMGMPFPLGLARVAATAENLIPWSWGINGCASVTGAVLATIVAIHWGFQMVIGLALILYALAAAAFWKPLK
jgi:SAM-dependent methyltransferase